MIRTVTVSSYRYQFEYNEFSCKFILNVYLGRCKVISNRQLCIGMHEIIDNVAVYVPDLELDNVQVQIINQPSDEPPAGIVKTLDFG